MEMTFLSSEISILFISSNEIVIPPSMLDAPGNAACPPLFAANGHCVIREISTALETARALAGLKMQCGFTALWRDDQYEEVKLSYEDEDGVRTREGPWRRVRDSHFRYLSVCDILRWKLKRFEMRRLYMPMLTAT